MSEERSRTMKASIISAIFLVVLAAAPALAQEPVDREFGDRILTFDDNGKILKLEKIKVVSATYEKVVYDQRGRTGIERPANTVLDIAYGDAPRVYLEGKTLIDKGEYEAAASDFAGARNAVDAGKAGKWLLEYAAVGRGQALEAMARSDSTKVNDAIEEFQKALAANPESLLYNQIQLGLARCYAMGKKWEDAKTAAKALVDVGTKNKFPVWLCQGQEELARVLVAQGLFADAANAWQDLVLSAQREIKWAKAPPIQRDLQTLETTGSVEQGWARIARAEKTGNSSDWSDAQSYFENLPSRYPDSQAVAAAALNGEGRCLLETDPRGAVMKFALAEVSDFTAKEEVARALYLKAKAYDKLAKGSGSPDYYRTMADKARKDLREFYGNTEWARK
jgi:tetratricopeptide (TPR) repeat protein